METIVIKPKNKEEFSLIFSILKKMDIRCTIQKKEIVVKKKAKE